ncbi:MAG: dihydrofolate reductase [Candidatus Electrothrix sp. YB6]
MELILIAAMAANRVIGRENGIPWYIPGEQIRFKEITMGHTLIMGRKTWQSIGRPLPGRRNIVVTRNTEFSAAGADVAHSLEQGITAAGEGKIFIIGGAQLYRQALDRADTLILTRLEQEIAGDAFFPEFTCPPFALLQIEEVSGPVSYRIETYTRRQTDPGF